MGNLSVRRERERERLGRLEDAVDGHVAVGLEIETAKRGRCELHERAHEVFRSDRPLDPAANLAEKRRSLAIVITPQNALEVVEQRQ